MSLEENLLRSEPSRRAEIIAVAHRLFLSQGFHATSMRQIANEVGIAVGGIYNHFNSKDEIFAAVLDAHHPYHAILPTLETAQGSTVEEFVRNASKLLIAELNQHPDFIKLMFIEIVEFNSRHIPPLFESIFPRLTFIMERFLGRQDNLRPIPVVVILRAFVGLFFSFYMTDMLLAGHFPSAAQVHALDYFVEIFLRGILVEPGQVAEEAS